MSSVSERLTGLMREKHISCRKLSDMTGITKSSVNNYANGLRSIPLDKLQLIANALDVSASWLIGWADNRDGSNNNAQLDQNIKPLESDFATNLKRIRLEKKMSQEEFANFLGTSKQNISRYELGEVSPKISTAAKMAEKLGISLTQLNGDNNEKKDPAAEQDRERERVVNLFLSLSEENQKKLIDYAQLLLTAQQAGRDS